MSKFLFLSYRRKSYERKKSVGSSHGAHPYGGYGLGERFVAETKRGDGFQRGPHAHPDDGTVV
jgi:hypothetical protein